MLTGITAEDAVLKTDGVNTYTYGKVIAEIFGTVNNPFVGKFYKINDADIEITITDNIYRDLLPIEKCLENITILDYFPDYITENFKVTLLSEDGSDAENAKIMTDDNGKQYISWKIDKLSPNETKILKYTLSLNEKYNEEIHDEILDTNEKVEISYTDFDGLDDSDSSDVTPKIKLVAPEPEPEPEPPKDVTVVPEEIPHAGSPIITIAFVVLLVAVIFFGYKSRKIR